jgi:2-polyprenyl-3-methyl-5-hydroxy-6-metoxy-1,4-benzoquinol methylase
LKLEDAIDLVRGGFQEEPRAEVWADLGCGNGLFTSALTRLLNTGSRIHAIDLSHQHLESVNPGIVITFQQLNFITDSLPFDRIDGILMGNSLHFVKNKLSFLRALKEHLKPNGRLVVIEYDMARANSWVPYPIAFESLGEVLADAGFCNFRKLNERKSIYENRTLYSSIAFKA